MRYYRGLLTYQQMWYRYTGIPRAVLLTPQRGAHISRLSDAPPPRVLQHHIVMTGTSAFLRSTYGCTAQESALADALAHGSTLAQTAVSLGISVHTARTHLKRVFRKTGTNRQAELVRLILLRRS